MKMYRVKWVIEVDAETPGEAAGMARAIQQDKLSMATVFEVTHLASGQTEQIDLG